MKRPSQQNTWENQPGQYGHDSYGRFGHWPAEEFHIQDAHAADLDYYGARRGLSVMGGNSRRSLNGWPASSISSGSSGWRSMSSGSSGRGSNGYRQCLGGGYGAYGGYGGGYGSCYGGGQIRMRWY